MLRKILPKTSANQCQTMKSASLKPPTMIKANATTPEYFHGETLRGAVCSLCFRFWILTE